MNVVANVKKNNGMTNLKNDKLSALYEYAIVLVLLILIVFFSIASPAFLTEDNFFNILRQVAVIGIIAVGMTLVMITGGIDLSVGSVVGVSGVVCAKLMVMGINPVISVLVAILVCGALGFINGLIVNVLSITPLITTLGTMTALRGVAFLITGGSPVFGFPVSFSTLGQGYVGIFPVPVLIMIIVFIFGYIYLEKLKLGRYIYGVGGNEEATRLSGINTKKIKYIVYIICGALSGLAGAVLLSRVNSGQPSAGTSYEMDVITAVVLGGVSITGGEGKIKFVIIGVILMGVLTNGMILLNIDDYMQWVIKGVVLIAAVGLDSLNQKRKKVSIKFN